jgi:methyl-accepting chemotaxis protein
MKNLSIQRKLIIFIVLPVVLCTSLIVVLSSIEIKNQGISNLIDKSNTILGLNILEFTEHHIDGTTIVEMDIEESIKEVTSELENNRQLYQFRIASPNPLNEKHLAKDADKMFFEKFKDKDVSTVTHIDKEKQLLSVIRPVYMSQTKGCLDCHASDSDVSSFGSLQGLFILESDIKPIQEQVNASIFQNSLVGFLILIVSIAFAIILALSFTKPIIQLKNITENLATGDLNQKFTYKSNDEIGLIAIAFNKLIKALNTIAEFSNQIGKGNFNQEYQLLSEKDTIGLSLINMRKSLTEAQLKEQERQKKEQLENWTNQGIAKFSDIMRAHSNSVENLSKNFIISLVNYVEAVQGGLFVINEEDPENIIYELKGAVAYNREKFLEKNFRLGESLVGRCAYEKLPIIMTEVPNNYVHITSGLGTANPNCILLVPAVLNNTVYAVIELVSFNVFEEHITNFVSNIGEDLASTIANTKTNEQTQKLLEQTQQQSEELAAQEEEMRQNLEELQATQEEMKRKEDQLKQILSEINVDDSDLKRRIDEFKNL